MTLGTNAPPSIDPANNDSLTGAFRSIFSKLMEGVDGVIPATVVAYDRTSSPKVVTVQPSVMIVSTSGERQPRGQIAEVPVFQMGGGNCGIDFNLLPGDTGLIFACDRDISAYIASGVLSAPATFRKQDFADSFFLPSILNGVNINSEDAANAVFTTRDGTVRVSLWPDMVKVTAPNGLVVDGPITTNGLLTAQSIAIIGGGGSVHITGDVNITGNTAVIGNITATGDITPHV